MGRPSKYSDRVAEVICSRIADGESLRTICKDRNMPGRQTVLGWLADKDNEGFRTRYAYAREAQADLYAEECIEIADTPVLGTKTVSREWGEEVTEADMIEHRRLQVLTRQWYASKLAPKKYGDKLQADLNHSGTVQVVKLNNEPAPEMPE